jgi:hypothetical protein
MKEAYAVRRTVPPSAEIQASIDSLLSKGLVDDPQKMLSELARLGARLIIQRAVEDEFTEWLGRARYERRPEAPTGKRNGLRTSTSESARPLTRSLSAQGPAFAPGGTSARRYQRLPFAGTAWRSRGSPGCPSLRFHIILGVPVTVGVPVAREFDYLLTAV